MQWLLFESFRNAPRLQEVKIQWSAIEFATLQFPWAQLTTLWLGDCRGFRSRRHPITWGDCLAVLQRSHLLAELHICPDDESPPPRKTVVAPSLNIVRQVEYRQQRVFRSNHSSFASCIGRRGRKPRIRLAGQRTRTAFHAIVLQHLPVNLRSYGPPRGRAHTLATWYTTAPHVQHLLGGGTGVCCLPRCHPRPLQHGKRASGSPPEDVLIWDP